MSSIRRVIINSSSTLVQITAELYITSNDNYVIYMTLYNMDGTAVKRGYQNFTEHYAPASREYTLTPDYPLPSATQYEYAIQLSYRDTGEVIDRETGYVSTKLEYFEWDAPKRRGEDINITASEWNRLLDTCAAEVQYVRKWFNKPYLC